MRFHPLYEYVIFQTHDVRHGPAYIEGRADGEAHPVEGRSARRGMDDDGEVDGVVDGLHYVDPHLGIFFRVPGVSDVARPHGRDEEYPVHPELLGRDGVADRSRGRHVEGAREERDFTRHFLDRYTDDLLLLLERKIEDLPGLGVDYDGPPGVDEFRLEKITDQPAVGIIIDLEGAALVGDDYGDVDPVPLRSVIPGHGWVLLNIGRGNVRPGPAALPVFVIIDYLPYDMQDTIRPPGRAAKKGAARANR